MSTSGSSSLNLGGMQVLSSMMGGIDYSSIIAQLYQAQKAPGDALNTTIRQDQLYINDWSNIANMANSLQNDLAALADSTTYNSFSTITTGSLASATAQSGASPGTYNITLQKAGTDATMTSSGLGLNGAIGKAATSSTLLSQNVFSQPITSGTVSFTYAGKSYSYKINISDSLGTTLSNLNALTSNNVTFALNSSNQVTVSVASTAAGGVVLGSAGDTSNFFQSLGLNGNTAAVGGSTTSHLVGVAQLGQPLQSANLSTTPNATPSGGYSTLLINGVTIKYNTASDSLESLMQSINNSTAGVTASYDPITDKMTLTSKSAQPITVKDGLDSNGTQGNLASILGLSGTSSAGTNWVYTVGANSGLSSPTPTISNAIPGVNFTFANSATANTSGTLTVKQNTDSLTKAINQFVGDFNNLYTQIEKYTGKGGDLQSDSQLNLFGMQIMNDVLSVVPAAQQAGDAQTTAMGLGLTTGPIGSSPGTTNSLHLNTSTLIQQFTANPTEVRTIFSGIATTLNNHLTEYTGTINNLNPLSAYSSMGEGVIQTQQDMYNTDIKNLEQEQSNIYTQAQDYEQNLAKQFTALQRYEEQMTMTQQELSAMGG